MAPLESYPVTGRPEVLGKIPEESNLTQAQVSAFRFLKEGGLEARQSPAEFGVWSFSEMFVGALSTWEQPVLIISEFSPQNRGAAEAIDNLKRNRPRNEAFANQLIEEEIPFFYPLKKSVQVLILPTGVLKIAMQAGLIPGVKPKEAAKLSQDKVWEKMSQGETADYFELSEEARKEIRWWLGRGEREKERERGKQQRNINGVWKH